jgi:DNA-binding Lrp family transcriptional regulator
MKALSPMMVPGALPDEEWLSALQEAMRPEAGAEAGKSVRELVETTGLSEDRIRTLIRKLQGQGRISVKRAVRTGIDGRAAQVPVYLIVGGADVHAVAPGREA